MPVHWIDATLSAIAIAGGLAGIGLIVRLLRP